MEKNNNDEWNAIIKKAVKEVGLEQPSADFTNSVLSKIEEVSEEISVTLYKPLISKLVWWVIAIIVIGIFTYMIFGNINTENSWLSTLILNKLPDYSFMGKILTINIPDTLVYAFVGLVFFVYVQIFLLKRYWDKRYALD